MTDEEWVKAHDSSAYISFGYRFDANERIYATGYSVWASHRQIAKNVDLSAAWAEARRHLQSKLEPKK